MAEFELIVDGEPRGKGRPRFDPRTGRAYTDNKTKLAEGRVHDAWVRANRPRLEGPIALLVTIVLQRPQAHFKVDGTFTAAGIRSGHPTKKPDFDNVAKLIGDALNKCAYDDDANIVHHWFVKRWANPGEHEHTRIVVRQMPTLLHTQAVAA